MRFSANHQRRRNDKQRGTSLIEVLIVLVILVVGIFSIARLFPGGFFAVRSAENNTFADRLSQAQLETLKQNDAFLLDAVYTYSGTNGFIASDSLTDLSGTTAQPYMGDATLNDINKARYIQGESFNIPTANTATDNNGVSIHTLNYGPVQLRPGANPPSLQVFTTTPANAPPAIAGLPPIHSAPWAAKTGNSVQTVSTDTTGTYNSPGGYENPSDLYAANQPNYAIDYTGQQIAVPSQNYLQAFTLVVTITFKPTPAELMIMPSATSETATYYLPLTLPANTSGSPYTGGWFNLAASYAGTPVVVGTPPAGVPLSGNADYATSWGIGSAALYRTYAPETPGGNLSATLTALLADSDPYKYVLLNPDPTLTTVSLGVLAFNPRLAGQQVSVSYLAYDWHIIHEDQDVPETPGTPMRLTLNHVKRVGDVQNDQTVYNGLFRNGDASSPYDIILLDTDTGDMQGVTVTDTTHIFDLDNASGSPTTDQVAISYDGGRITLPTDPAAVWSSANHKHLRIFYEGDLDWAVAIQKPPNLYTAGDPTTQVATYAANALRLDFPKCDLGDVVAVDNISYVDSSGNSHQVTNATGTIAVDSLSADTNPSIDLSPFLPNAAATQPAGQFLIGDVRGVSARSVVIWKERTAWKSRSLDTILTRAQ